VLASEVDNTSKNSVPVTTHNKKENLGWHHYWDEEKAKKEKEKKKKSVSAPTSSASKPLKPFSTKWFKANFQIIQQRAIDSPTKNNLRALLYAERVMADKSEVFARRKQFEQSVDPLLQEGTRIPMMGAAKNALLIYKDEQKQEALQEIQKYAGIALFYDGACKFCKPMIPVINLMKLKLKLDIRVFAKNAPGNYIPKLISDIPVYPDNGYSEQFNISYWPAVVMLRPPQDVFVISQGSLTLNELTKRMVNVAFDQNILDEEWYYRVYPEQKDLINPDKIRDLPVDIASDPVELINQVVDMIGNPQGKKASQEDIL